MTDVSLMPERDVFQCHNGVTPNNTRQSAQSFVGNGISLVRHCRTAFLAFTKEFFDLKHFGSLKMTEFSRPPVDAGGDHCERSHEFSVPVALHDLGRKHGRFQSQFLAYPSFDFWIDVRVGADGTANFSNANPLAGL